MKSVRNVDEDGGWSQQRECRGLKREKMRGGAGGEPAAEGGGRAEN